MTSLRVVYSLVQRQYRIFVSECASLYHHKRKCIFSGKLHYHPSLNPDQFAVCIFVRTCRLGYLELGEPGIHLTGVASRGSVTHSRDPFDQIPRTAKTPV